MGIVKSKKYGIIHGYASCNNCYWSANIDVRKPNPTQRLRNEIYKHIKETKHSVDLDIGKATKYFYSESPL